MYLPWRLQLKSPSRNGLQLGDLIGWYSKPRHRLRTRPLRGPIPLTKQRTRTKMSVEYAERPETRRILFFTRVHAVEASDMFIRIAFFNGSITATRGSARSATIPSVSLPFMLKMPQQDYLSERFYLARQQKHGMACTSFCGFPLYFLYGLCLYPS